MEEYNIYHNIEEKIANSTISKLMAPTIKDTRVIRMNMNYIRQLSEDYNIPIQDVAEIADTLGDYNIANELPVELDNYYSCYY